MDNVKSADIVDNGSSVDNGNSVDSVNSSSYAGLHRRCAAEGRKGVFLVPLRLSTILSTLVALSTLCP